MSVSPLIPPTPDAAADLSSAAADGAAPGAAAHTGRRGRGRTRPTKSERARRRFAWALIAPAALFMLVVHALPMAGGFVLSFKTLNTFTFSRLFDAPWAGLGNYRSILFDSANPLHAGFAAALRNTGVYVGATVTLSMVGGMAIAVLLNRPMRGQRLVKTLIMTPWIVPSFVVATLWGFMWQSDVGVINKLLVDWTGLLSERPTWLIGDNAIWAIVIPSVWRALPLNVLLFLAALQAIPRELDDAAAVDGAGSWQRFRYVTLPLLRPIIAVQGLFSVIYATYQFAIPYVMLGSNPGPKADLLMTLIVRQSFSNNLFGFGAAASTLVMLVMLVFVVIWLGIFRRDLEAAR